MDYEEARRQALAAVDAFNRRDLDALVAVMHEEMTHLGSMADRHLGQEPGRVEGKPAFRDFVRWLWEQEPPLRIVLEEVFTGPRGYVYLTRREHDGARIAFVREVDADGLIRSQRAYYSRPSAG